MLTIEINKDIEEFKDDFAKGLSLRECVYVVATVIAGAGTYLLSNKGAGIPSNISVYMTLAACAPVALCGFYKKNGMYFAEIIKRYIKVAFARPSVYQTDYLEKAKELKQLEKSKEKKRVKGRKKEK